MSLVAGALLFFLFNPSGQFFFPKCPIHDHLGIYCSGCGSQRAIHDLLHLRIYDAVSHNLLLIPALITIAIELSMRFFYPHKKSIFYYKYTPLIVLGIIVIFMILRNIDQSPFNWLAP
ncbi:DUF2752 domain-containing protein [Muricauda sp. DJ-13]|uniref:DUF2752 domain-containing protein n=1 Tax=Croceivirga thetidis TaxID=2721623 RepID=A0ABX1GSF1_9FLAO|nr:DUF2752 domain-containing protein [Croceivirga thetidis]